MTSVDVLNPYYEVFLVQFPQEVFICRTFSEMQERVDALHLRGQVFARVVVPFIPSR